MGGILILNILFDCITTLCMLLAINWTTPLFVGLGSLLNIPVSIVLDMIIHEYLLPVNGFIGIFCIIGGFIMLSLADILMDRPLTYCLFNLLTKSLFRSQKIAVD